MSPIRKKKESREFEIAAEVFRRVVESAPNAMVMVDSAGTIVLVNQQTEKLFGYARSELLGRPVEILVPRSVRAKHEAYRHGYAAAPETRKMGAGRDLFGVRKDGSEVPVEIGLNPIEVGAQTYFLAAVVDISERKDLERRLLRSEALAAVGSMAAVMAHEIRNPLGSIVMAAKSLLSGDLDAGERKTIGSVLSEESQRLSRTLQDFLQYARPREPKRAQADLNETVGEIIEAVKTDGGLAKKLSFEVSLDKDLGPFPHDPDQIRQVLWNLILNGVQAMSGKGRLKVATALISGRAVFTVTDSGPGIDAKTLPRVFEPFFTTKSKGTGLGLAIAQRIVQAHGGGLAAENVKDGGARFTMVLPLSIPKPFSA